MYSAKLLDHFEHPRNSGVVEHPSATVQLENPVCGDVLRLSAKLAQGRIVEIRFQAKGCVPAMACGSAVTELAHEKSIADAARIRKDDIVNHVGGVPEASTHAAQLAADALTNLAKELASLSTVSKE
ncbi:MAG TPA: iron-sulfur cluster assembly scaffold protein [Terriglobales bacterium]